MHSITINDNVILLIRFSQYVLLLKLLIKQENCRVTIEVVEGLRIGSYFYENLSKEELIDFTKAIQAILVHEIQQLFDTDHIEEIKSILTKLGIKMFRKT